LIQRVIMALAVCDRSCGLHFLQLLLLLCHTAVAGLTMYEYN
jgi:hypothetical protein